jgi:hypothetical protein
MRVNIKHMTAEFEALMHDPDLESERGPGGTLIFRDGSQYCVVGPDFVSTEESDCYAFGETKAAAIANYALKTNITS